MSSQQKVNKLDELERFLQAFQLYLDYLARDVRKELTGKQTVETWRTEASPFGRCRSDQGVNYRANWARQDNH